MNLFNIFDPERGLYWNAGCHGYTLNREFAHKFSSGEADDICNRINVKDFKIPVESEWTQVGGYEDIPVGLWLVKLDIPESINPYQVAEINEKASVIGHHFAFDEVRVLSYRKLGELL